MAIKQSLRTRRLFRSSGRALVVAMDSGAVGITMGRNIWDHDNVAGITAALAAVIHDDASVETAYKHIG